LKILGRTALLVLAVWVAFSGPGATLAQDGDSPVAQTAAVGQTMRFEHLTTEDGLSEGRVWGITQDSRGFMWFATWDGVNRYDGYEFKVYKQEPGRANGPGGSSFWPVYTDQAGKVWAGSHTGGGLSRFDPTTELWTVFRHDKEDAQSLGSNNVYAILEDSSGVLWVGTEGGGLNRLEGVVEDGRARFNRYQHDPNDAHSLGSDYVASIYEDRSGVLWIGAYGGGLHRFDRETETFVRYQHDAQDPHSLSDDRVYGIYEDQFGVLWVGTHGGGLNRFDRETETFVNYQVDTEDPHSLSGNTITSIAEDGSGTLWIGTFDGGLNRYHRETDTFSAYQHDLLDPRTPASNTVLSLFVDRTGTLWIGTAGKGISKLDPAGQGFRLYGQESPGSNGLSNSDVRAIVEDRSGDVWIGTWGGLNRFDPETGHFTHYLHDPDDPTSLSDNHVHCALEDSGGTLWVGVGGAQGLNRFDRDTETFSHFRHDPDDAHSLSGNSIVRLYEDRTGILWVGTWSDGLNALDLQSQDGEVRFARYQHDPTDPDSLGAGIVHAIYQDRGGTLWVGTGGGGLCQFHRDSETFACYDHDPQDAGSLSDDTVWAIYEDRAGTLWVGTSGGLNRLDAQIGEFLHYTTADGLPHNTVFGILEGNASSSEPHRSLWLSTSHGLSRFDPQTGTFHNYDASDGLQGDVFNNGAYYQSSTGELFFGGPNGLTVFHPDDIRNNPHVPPVYLTAIQLANKPVSVGGDSLLQKSLLDTRELVLSHRDRIVSFEFAALSFTSPQKNRYRYALEGFDGDWYEVGSDRRFATYTNLDPGHYTFRVLGSNNDGVWNEEGASLSITITPPWWETWWFRGLLIALVAGLVVAGYRSRVTILERRSQELEREVETATRDLKQRLVELDVLNQIAQMVATLTDLPKALDAVTEVVTSQFAATASFTVMWGTGQMEVLAWSDRDWVSSDMIGRLLPMTSNPAVREPLDRGEAISIPDILSVPWPAELEHLFRTRNFRAVLIAPLRVRGTAFGALAVMTDEAGRAFSRDEISLAETIASDVAAAIENARLYEQAQEVAVSRERQRLARDLHDSVTQTLYSVALSAEVLPRIWETHPDQAQAALSNLHHLARGALSEMRSLLFELQPAMLLEKGPEELLRQLAHTAMSRTQTKVETNVHGERALPDKVRIALYRITQEALNNIAKHAEAGRAIVELDLGPEQVVLQIEDDGPGFDPTMVPRFGFGVRSMADRAKDIGAEFHLDSQPGQGTQIQVVWRPQDEWGDNG
jgi:signal transduction histidine kinase/ligand-binding sensor domain-containing protein